MASNADLGLIAPVDKDGKLQQTTSTSTTAKKKSGELGKDDFLQLLVAQMKYQDPLEPTDNTQYISQLATFSQLEMMQNLNATTVNSQAFSLVGKEVIIKTESTTGNVTYKQGVVDLVTMSGNKTYLSIEGKLYNMDDLQTVIGKDYIISQKVPKVKETLLSYDHSDPKDMEFEVTLGKDEYEASMVAVYLNGQPLDGKYLTHEVLESEEGSTEKRVKIIISKDAFKKLPAGSYPLGLIFDDPNLTAYTDKVVLTVTGDMPPAEETPPEEGEDGEGSKDDGDGAQTA